MAIMKGKKMNVMGRVKTSVMPVLVGAGFGILEDAIGLPTDPEKIESQEDMLNYGSLVAGIALPILVPKTEKIGDALAAIGAYKVSKKMEIAKSLGLGEKDEIKGLGDRHALGDVNRMFSEKSYSQKKNIDPIKGNKTPQPLG